MNSGKQSRLTLLDGLRGTAAFAVVIYHCSTLRDQHGTLFGTGFLAVDFFFILSGFVLTLAFEPKFAKGLGTFGFMELRVRRLWPALTAGACLGALALFLETPSLLVLPLLLLTLIMYPVTQPGSLLFFLNPVQWSLAFELLANLAHVTILGRLSNRALHGVCAGLGIILAIEIYRFNTAGFGSFADSFIYGIPRAGFSYVLGILLARRWRGEPSTPTRSWWLHLPAPVAVIVVVGLLPASLRGLGEALAVFLAMPLVFLAAIRTKAPQNADRWLSRLGAISYPLYAVHYPILKITIEMQTNFAPESPDIVWDWAGIIIALTIAQCMAMAGTLMLSRKRRVLSPALVQ